MIPYHWDMIVLSCNIFLQLLGCFTKVEVEPKKLDNNEFEKNDFRRYLSYKYDHPSINIYEYFKLFKYFDELSEDIYDLSIYKNFYELI
ncbi:hypothetical protein WY13_00282 [Clostridium ljungdahlii]|uniref:Uncharacterized protein n=1 Tax=Clostridium ljungdahlii TaxID=1538 RepID=A0A166SA05_9CLOT|nr:hypothetical protein WY13_00282 [Clostridium ljungdahlii]